MKKIIFALSILVLSNGAFAQNVGIGTNTPDASAKLDITSANSGLLVPRVSLISTTDVATILVPATSLLVYNTNVGITGGSGVGYYSWNGTAWTKLLTSSGTSSDWSLAGNAATNAGTNFIGTTDAVDFVARTSNVERMRILAGGNVGIGTATPAYRLDLGSGTFGFGSSNQRTETRANAGLQGNAGAQSGFFETSAPVNYPSGASSWWHLIDVRHSNTANNYALQIAGSFFDQELYFRKTNNNAAAGWSRLLSDNTGWTTTGNPGTNPATNFVGTTNAVDFVTRTGNVERMRVTSAGNVGIGTAAPGYRLQANGDIYANGGWMRVSGNQGLYFESWGGGWHMTDATWIRAYNNKPVYVQNLLRADQGVYATDFVRLLNSNANQFGSINAFGANGVTLEQHVSESGGFHADGDQADIWSPGDGGRLLRVWDEDGMVERWYLDNVGNAFTVSDRTKKTNIEPLNGGLDAVLSLQAYKYNFKMNGNEAEKLITGEHVQTTSIGVMAQDVEKVIPEAVNTDENGNKHMSYDMLVPVLIEAIKEQQQQIDVLKAKIEELEIKE
ncbi:MAG: hypothetical protein ACJA1C_000450 [Crocinitomicaceae bacterium]|jgi:hypothetical protein